MVMGTIKVQNSDFRFFKDSWKRIGHLERQGAVPTFKTQGKSCVEHLEPFSNCCSHNPFSTSVFIEKTRSACWGYFGSASDSPGRGCGSARRANSGDHHAGRGARRQKQVQDLVPSIAVRVEEVRVPVPQVLSEERVCQIPEVQVVGVLREVMRPFSEWVDKDVTVRRNVAGCWRRWNLHMSSSLTESWMFPCPLCPETSEHGVGVSRAARRQGG